MAHSPRSRAAFASAGRHLLGGVPMTWMRMWPGGFPVYQAAARGARLTTVDGRELIDFCLGDTGAMAGHSPAAVTEAVARRYTELGGATTMLPTEDAAWVAEFNDAAALERELAHGDVAAVLMEPALTNIGIVLPRDGYLAQVRELTRAAGTLLINDETHTFSAGPGGCTAAWGLDPDMVTIGKSIGGGVPCGAYGLDAGLAERILGDDSADIVDTGGVGGTLAGNALSVAAMRACLGSVLTDAAFAGLTEVATSYTESVRAVLTERSVPWSITQLGARAEYRFTPSPPVSGGESAAAADSALDEYMHLYTVNRGILMTPFHNMALMSPATTKADVAAHTKVFAAAVSELTGE